MKSEIYKLNHSEDAMPEIEAARDKVAVSQLQLFFAKVAIVTAAVLVVIFYANSSFQAFVEKQTFLRGGPAFWESVEQRLDKLADARDLPPEKKQKILAALSKISDRYKPYFDALAGQRPKD
jgi:hypothetical protein